MPISHKVNNVYKVSYSITIQKRALNTELTELLRTSVIASLFATLETSISLSFASSLPVHPQLLLSAFGPDSGKPPNKLPAPADDLVFGPEVEAGRTVADLAFACCDTKCELLVVDADDGGGGVNLTVVDLLPARTALSLSSLMLRIEDVDMFSEDDDFLTSSDSSRLSDVKLGFMGFSMPIAGY